MVSRALAFEGAKFGRLTVVSNIQERRGDFWMVKVICECGKTRIVRTVSLTSGHTLSCGCSRKETFIHGHSRTNAKSATYRSWGAMKDRCSNRNHSHWKNYGGRGIKVCARWKNSFENFLNDVGECPPGLEIERINNDAWYKPGNCRWATRKEQARNTRLSKIIVYQGRKQHLIEVARELNILPHTLYCRIFIYGWSVERSISEPVRRDNPKVFSERIHIRKPGHRRQRCDANSQKPRKDQNTLTV